MKPLLLFSLLFAGGVQATDATYADFLATARTQFEAKNFDGARASMQSALAVAKTPDEKFGALLRIGKTFDEQNNSVRAREFYKQAVAQPGIAVTDKVGASFSIGDDLHKEKKLAEARKVFEAILADAQTPLEMADIVRFNIAQVLLEEGQTARGRALLSGLGESKAQLYLRVGAWIQLGQSFRDAKDWQKAQSMFDKVLAVPDVAPTFQAIAHTERIKTFVGQNDAASAQKEAVLFADQMSKEPVSPSLDVMRERLAATLAVLENPDAHAPVLLVLTTHERLAAAFLVQGDYATGRAQMGSLLQTLLPLETDATSRSSALNLKTVALWDLAGSYERQGDSQKARELFGQVLQIPGLEPFYKDAVQKKLAAQKK